MPTPDRTAANVEVFQERRADQYYIEYVDQDSERLDFSFRGLQDKNEYDFIANWLEFSGGVIGEVQTSISFSLSMGTFCNGDCLKSVPNHTRTLTKKPGKLSPISSPEGPFQLIDIDYYGPLTRTPRGNQYVVCVTDYFTRWVTVVALPDCSAQTTAPTVFKEYICRYRIPKSILSDQGMHLNNQLIQALAKLIGYDHIYSTFYHLQTNGMVERFNAIFIPQLAKLKDRENNNWEEFLLPVVFDCNTGIHKTIAYSPFQLHFGPEPRLPTDEPSTLFTFNKPNDYSEQLKKNLMIIRQQARDNITHQQQQYKKSDDEQRPGPHYEINGFDVCATTYMKQH